MKSGDKIKAFVKIGLMKNPDWKRGEYVEESDGHKVCVYGQTLTVERGDLKLWRPLDNYDEALQRFAKANWEELKALVKAAAGKFLPGEAVDVNENEHAITINDVTVSPGCTEVKTISSFCEFPCWVVSYWETTYSYTEPPDADEVICGESRGNIGAARLLVDSILKMRADSYWDSVSDDGAWSEDV